MKDIKLRPWILSDLQSLVNYANNRNISKNLRDAFPFPYTKKDGITFIEEMLKDNPTKIFAIELDDKAVGSIGVFPQSDIHRKNAELGYWLAEPYWGKGIMVKAIEKMLDYAFNTFDIDRVYATPFGYNKASQRVLEKSGFSLEAKLEKALYKSGEYIDEYIYGIRKDRRKLPEYRPAINRINVVIDCKDAGIMAEFYSKLLRWEWTHPQANGWAAITSPTGMVFAFQEREEYQPPVWPWESGKQGQMLHLDFYVDDLEKAVQHAIKCGAVLAKEQYFKTSATLFDPAGHPFCLDTDEPE